MIAPRWRKVVRDVFDRPGRSALAVLAMAAGIFEISAMLYKYAVLQPELTGMYGRTHPASATLIVDRVSDGLIDSVRRVPGVADAEARPVVVTRVRVGEEWMPALLYVVRDFDRLRIDTFEPDQGAWPPGDGDVLLERTALQVAKVASGDSLTLRLAGGDEAVLRVAGTVYAAGLAPAWMEHMVPGFVTWGSRARSEAGESAQIRIVVADHPLDEGYIREVADSVKAAIERGGQTVSRITVPTPGRHPHADQMAAFLFLILSFGILSFALSSVLVAGMIHALMAEQVKQVGMMKAIGATSRQIAGLYLGQVGLLAAASLAVGLPLGFVAGRAYARFAAGILNADVSHAAFPWWVVVLVSGVGVLVPLAVALGPVLRAARITVREALSDDPGRPFGSRRTDRWFASLRWVPRPLMISLRSTFVRRGRLALTIVMLAVGGAAFMSALNVSRAWTRQVDRDFARRRWDLTVVLANPTAIATLEDVLAAAPGVVTAEYWSGASPYLIGASGVPGGTVSLVGASSGSRLLELPLAAGRWLGDGPETGAVVNQAVLVRNPALAVGDSVRMRLQGRDLALAIVGVARELNPMPVVYASREAVLAATGQDGGLTRTIRVVTAQHDDEGQRAVAGDLERALAARGIEVTGMIRSLDQRQGILDHLVIIMSILTAASVIVVFVGGLGLTSTLTLNVVQRTREIGILGAIGATPSTISRHVWFEGVLIGVLSWVLANVLAAPVSWALETATGNIFFKAPLDFYLSPEAAATWLGIVIVLASISSFYPARRAARLTVREALAHT